MKPADLPGTKAPASEALGEQALALQDWSRIQANLTAFAFRRTARRSMEHAEDLAQEAISKFLARPGAWDPEKEPLLKHLSKRVIGLASNEWHRKRSAFEVAMETYEAEATSVPGDEESTDEVLDRRRFAAQFRVRLEGRVAGDENALAVVALMAEGLDSPAALVEASSLTLAQVREARRRIFYHAEIVSKELGHELDSEDDEHHEDDKDEEAVP